MHKTMLALAALAALAAAVLASPVRAVPVGPTRPNAPAAVSIYRGDFARPRAILLAQATGAPASSVPASAATAAGVHYAGKLDLATDPTFEPMVMRELHDGMWLMGMQTTIWHLERTTDGAELLHVAAFWVTRPEGTYTAYGANVGTNLGPALRATIGQIAAVADGLANLPPWVTKVTNVTSIEGDGGYRPHTSGDDHHWIYGVSGKVTVKFSDLSCWVMKSCPGSTGL